MKVSLKLTQNSLKFSALQAIIDKTTKIEINYSSSVQKLQMFIFVFHNILQEIFDVVST